VLSPASRSRVREARRPSLVATDLLVFIGVCVVVSVSPGPAVLYRVRADRTTDMQVAEEPLGMIFRQGIIVNLTNPKTVLFLLAFLPQFVGEDAGPVWQQMLVLGFTFIVVAGLTDGVYALAAGHLRGKLQQGQTPRWSGYFAGGVYVLLGLLGLWDAARQLA